MLKRTVLGALVALGTLCAQNGPRGIFADQETKDNFIKVLARHPDRELADNIKDALAAGNVDLSVLPDFKPHNASDGWQVILMNSAVSWARFSAIPLPSDFFVRTECEQAILVEVLGRSQEYLAGVNSEALSLLSEFADPTANPDTQDETTEDQRKNLLSVINGFERLAANNASKFSSIVFGACRREEINVIFGNEGTADEKEFTALVIRKSKQELDSLKYNVNY